MKSLLLLLKKKAFMAIFSVAVLSVGGMTAAPQIFPTVQQKQAENKTVLGTATQANLVDDLFQVNYPTEFTNLVTFDKNIFANGDITIKGKAIFDDGIQTNGQDIVTGTGKIIAPNVLYGITAGSGIGLTTGQTPTISNTGVTSLQGSTGDLKLVAGSNISIDGLTISANSTDGGSSQSIFKNFAVSGQNSIVASNNNDTVTFVPGMGITLSTDATNKKLTISTSISGNAGASGIANYIAKFSNATDVVDSAVYDSGTGIGIGTITPAGLFAVGAGSPFTVNNTGDVIANSVNGNTITSGTGTLTLASGKSLTINGNTVLDTNGITFDNSGSVVIPASQTVTFGGSFATSGSNSLTLTTTGPTNITLPTTGLLLTGGEVAGQSVISTQNSGTVFAFTDSTNISAPITGLEIGLSGSGGFDQTGLKFDLSNASGANVNDIVGTGGNWRISTSGNATFQSISTTAIAGASITSSGTFLAADGSANTPSYAFTNSTATGLYRAGADTLGIATAGVSRLQINNIGQVAIGSSAPVGLFSVNGQTPGQSLATLNYTGSDQNILVASHSGSLVFALNNSGDITTGTWQGTTVGTTFGGTGLASYTTGDLIYASSTNTLSQLGKGSDSQVLTISPTTHLPVWADPTGGSGLCTDCVINDPTVSSTNTIVAGNSTTTPLSLVANASQSSDLFDIFASDGTTKLFAVNNAGDITAGIYQGSVIGAIYGGTGINTYATGDLLYATGTNALGKLPAGSDGKVLTVAGGVPTWATFSGGSGGLCADCLISDPTTSATNTISPATTGVVGLTLRETSVGTGDILDLQSAGGGTTYAKFDSNGNLTLNDIAFLANGTRYKIDTNGSLYADLVNADQVSAGLYNGNIISTGSGTLTLGAGKTLTANSSLTLAGTDGKILTVNDSDTLGTNSIGFVGGGILTLAANKNVTFADAFTTNGAGNPITLTATGSTNVTLPTTGTLLTNTEAANQTITSTQTTGTLLNLTDSTNIAGNIVGQAITLSGTGAFNQTGLQFNLTGASGARLNDIVGSNNSWSVSSTGVATFAGIVTGSSGVSGYFQRNGQALAPTNITDDFLIGATSTASAFAGFAGTAQTTGNQAFVNANSLTSGYGLNVTSTSTGLISNGALGYYYYNPGSNTTSTGDVLDLNVGPNASGTNGSIANIFNVMDNGSSLFAVSQSGVTINEPLSITSPGDLSLANDLNFTNPTASYIKTAAPLFLQAGDIFGSSNIEFDTFNGGVVVANTQAFMTTSAASISGQLTIGSTSVDPTQIGQDYITNASVFGKALETLNQTEGADIFTASTSGTPEFTIASNGTVTMNGNLLPMTNGTQNIGSSTLLWNNIYANNVFASNLSGTQGYIQRNNGTIAPANITDDFLLGGISTASAKFAFINNIGAGVPTASISGTSNNALSINATGNIGTTNRQTLVLGTTSTGNIILAPNGTTAETLFGNGDVLQASTDTIGNGFALNANSITTGNVATISANALTTGFGLGVYSSSTTLAAGGALGSFNWNPASGTVSTGDVLDLNVGAGSTLANIFNVMDNGSTDFSVSQSQITANLPVNFTAPGDTGFAYDVDFTNPVSSFIKSSAPLSIYSGETFNSSNLTLGTYNQGTVIIDSQSLLTNGAASVSGQLVLGSSSAPTVAFGEDYITNASVFGKALETLNQTEGADIFTASTSGTPEFTIASNGTVTMNGNLLPMTNGTQNIGSSTLLWNNIYANNVFASNLSGTQGYIQRNNGTIAPANITDDFLLGGTSTTSAKFAFINNIGSGVPTASVSAGTTGGIFLTAAGNLSTTANQTLTFGAVGTGNIQLAPNGNIAETLLGNGNVGIGTSVPSSLFTVSGGTTGGNAAAVFNQTGFAGNDILSASASGQTRFTLTNSGDATQSSTEVAGTAYTLNANNLTTGNGFALNANALTSGFGLKVTSTSTALTTNGALGYYYYNPASATNSTGDVLDLNVGANASGVNGSIANIFNVMDNGSTVFSVSQTAITANVPLSLNAPGDFSLAYDLSFTNPVSSNIKSLAPLNIYAGDVFNSSPLTLGTYNSGNVYVDSQALVALQAATISGQLVVGSSANPTSMGEAYITNSSTFGKSLVTLNQTENEDILTASASGTTKFAINNNGDLLPGASGTQNIGSASLAYNSIYGTTLTLPTTTATTGIIYSGGSKFIHNFGSSSTFVGVNAGNFSFTGTGNEAGFGTNALNGLSTGNDNSAFGSFAMASGVVVGNDNSAFGNVALQNVTSGGSNSAFGSFALQNLATGSNESAFGYGAMSNGAVSGNSNSAFGNQALQNLSSGGSNSAFGNGAMALNAVSGNSNSAFGDSTLYNITSGTGNSAFGSSALIDLTAGNNESAFGYLAMANADVTGSNNSAFGYLALFDVASGSNNSGFGNEVLKNLSTGANNIGMGTDALQNITAGNDNAALGYNALSQNSASDNVAIGSQALSANDAGANGVGVGYQAGMGGGGNHNVNGSFNTYLGANTGDGIGGDLTNVTTIGYNALVSENNALILGGTGTYAVNVGIGTQTPLGVMDIEGGFMGGNAAEIVNQTGSTTNDIFTASSSGSTKFVIQYNGNVGINDSSSSINNTLKVNGSLCVNNAAGACSGAISGNIYAQSTSITGADYAENYISSQQLVPGELVAMSNDGNNQAVIAATDSNSANILGVVSTDPGVTINSGAKTDGSHPYLYPIALIGRVPVRVSTANGVINAGDSLTASGTPGVAVKATKAGTVVGRALESYTNPDASQVATITADNNVTWFDPSIYIASDGNVVSNSSSGSGTQQIAGAATVAEPDATQQEITDLQTTIANLSSQVQSIASSEATLQTMVNDSILPTFSSTVSAQLTGANLTTDTDGNATISGQLNVLGRTTLTDLGVTGNITNGLVTMNGLESSIDSVGQPLKLQSLASAGISLENGAVAIDTHGNMVVNASVTADKYKVDISDPQAASLGIAVIPAGQTTFTVTTSAVTPVSEIFVTSKTAHSGGLSVTSQTSATSFTVTLDKPATTEVKFNWWIVN